MYDVHYTTQSPSTPYCKYLLINLSILLICGQPSITQGITY